MFGLGRDVTSIVDLATIRDSRLVGMAYADINDAFLNDGAAIVAWNAGYGMNPTAANIQEYNDADARDRALIALGKDRDADNQAAYDAIEAGGVVAATNANVTAWAGVVADGDQADNRALVVLDLDPANGDNLLGYRAIGAGNATNANIQAWAGVVADGDQADNRALVVLDLPVGGDNLLGYRAIGAGNATNANIQAWAGVVADGDKADNRALVVLDLDPANGDNLLGYRAIGAGNATNANIQAWAGVVADGDQADNRALVVLDLDPANGDNLLGYRAIGAGNATNANIQAWAGVVADGDQADNRALVVLDLDPANGDNLLGYRAIGAGNATNANIQAWAGVVADGDQADNRALVVLDLDPANGDNLLGYRAIGAGNATNANIQAWAALNGGGDENHQRALIVLGLDETVPANLDAHKTLEITAGVLPANITPAMVNNVAGEIAGNSRIAAALLQKFNLPIDGGELPLIAKLVEQLGAIDLTAVNQKALEDITAEIGDGDAINNARANVVAYYVPLLEDVAAVVPGWLNAHVVPHLNNARKGLFARIPGIVQGEVTADRLDYLRDAADIDAALLEVYKNILAAR